MVGQHDKGRQIFILAAERVAHPRAHSGKARPLKARRLQVRGLAVHARLADEIMDESQVVGHLPERGYNIREMFTTLTVPFELEGRTHPRAQPILEGLHVFTKVALFAMMPNECGFEIKRIQMACRSTHKELDDPLGLGWVMERAV